MAVTAMAGVVSFGPQIGLGSVATSWYKHRVTQIDLAPNDDTRLGVPEVGGIPVPTFPYKAGIVVSGGMTLQPRLESVFGWLLCAALGSATTASNVDDSTMDHVFRFKSDASNVPFISVRKAIPRKSGGADTDLGEIFKDCKVTSLAMTFPNDAPITARVDVLGREFTFDHDPSVWSYVNASFEDYPSIPVGCETNGYLKLPDFDNGAELPVVAATVTFQNIPLDLRQERVFGSPFLEDITIVMRQLTFDVLVKWNDPKLYASILTGSITGTAWTAQPYTGRLEVFINSPSAIGSGASTHYSLKIEASECMFAMTEGITLAGNQAVMARFTGTALAPPSGDYCRFTLHNKVTAYSWPT